MYKKANQICSQRVTHKNKIEWPSYKHCGSAAEKHAHIRILNSETERKPTTWIVTHEVVDAPEYFPCILLMGMRNYDLSIGDKLTSATSARVLCFLNSAGIVISSHL